MDNVSVHRWRQDEVTQHLYKLIEDAKELVTTELLTFGTETPKLSNKYFFLQGQLRSLDLILEAELGESDEENVQDS